MEGGRGWSGPPCLLLQLQSVSDQLLIHSSFTKTTNGGHTRAEAGQDAGSRSSLLLLQKQSSTSLSLLSLHDFIYLLSVISPVSLFQPRPLTCFSATNQQLSQPRPGQVRKLQSKPLLSHCSHLSGCCFQGRQPLPQHSPFFFF